MPKSVPSGTKYQTSLLDWSHASWEAIGFLMAGPQYYAYEYETSPNGLEVTVRAIGDIDANRTESPFELGVTVRNGDVVIAPQLRETEPLE